MCRSVPARPPRGQLGAASIPGLALRLEGAVARRRRTSSRPPATLTQRLTEAHIADHEFMSGKPHVYKRENSRLGQRSTYIGGKPRPLKAHVEAALADEH
jgi:hypothetical protein